MNYWFHMNIGDSDNKKLLSRLIASEVFWFDTDITGHELGTILHVILTYKSFMRLKLIPELATMLFEITS